MAPVKGFERTFRMAAKGGKQTPTRAWRPTCCRSRVPWARPKLERYRASRPRAPAHLDGTHPVRTAAASVRLADVFKFRAGWVAALGIWAGVGEKGSSGRKPKAYERPLRM